MRASPFDSDTAAKHLLRNLHDPAAVRVNPLVQHFFETRGEDGRTTDPDDALAAVREAVLNTVNRVFSDKNAGRARLHLQRQREIIMRCHIGGESDKVVQDEMALGRRQFYREKQRARVRLAKALHTLVPARLTSDAACVDVRELSLSHFRALRETGDAAGAIRLARSMWDAESDPLYKLITGALVVECYAEHGLWNKADELLTVMNALAADGPRLRAWLSWARGQRHWLFGAFDRSVRSCEETITHLHDSSITREARDDELLCWTYLQLAHSRHMLGGYESALAALQSAREVLERRPTLPPRVNANVLYHLGGVLSAVPGCMESALRHLQEAYSITTSHGLIRDASGIALLLSHLYAKSGEIERALEIGRQGLAISERVRGDAGHAWQCISFAPVEMFAGNVHRALELARFGGRSGGREPTRLAHAHTVEAEVLLRMGDAPSALRLAADATLTLHSHGHAPRLLSRAARVYTAATKRADERVARSIIGEIAYERDARDLLDSLRGR
ncbi:MAG TPA: hypothetical protein VJP85_07040 [Candidatus Baltobacteraceae bacterium]|nr:hypothetical protein [Candidatus Baltobacteraceae bacterium]